MDYSLIKRFRVAEFCVRFGIKPRLKTAISFRRMIRKRNNIKSNGIWAICRKAVSFFCDSLREVYFQDGITGDEDSGNNSLRRQLFDNHHLCRIGIFLV